MWRNRQSSLGAACDATRLHLFPLSHILVSFVALLALGLPAWWLWPNPRATSTSVLQTYVPTHIPTLLVSQLVGRSAKLLPW
jgi:hypothetical protein